MLIEPFKTILRIFKSMAYVVEFQTGHPPTGESKVDIKVADAFERSVDDLPSPAIGSPSSTESIASTNYSIPSNEESIGSSATSITTVEEPAKSITLDAAVPEATPSTQFKGSTSPIVTEPSPTHSLDAEMLEVPTALVVEDDVILPKRPFEDLACQALNIIRKYEHNTYARTGIQNAGEKFLPMIEHYMEKNERIKMVLPAFPCKSVNKIDKVLGTLPDLGEELALAHLNGMCDSITEIYEPGAEVVITSDGLVYSDILGISDSDVWDYSVGVRDLIKSKNLRHLSTLRIVDLLEHSRSEVLTREEYILHAGCYRREMIAKFAPKDLNLREAIKNEPDTCMTYLGYVKFLIKDLRNTAVNQDAKGKKLSGEKMKQACKKIALAMIERGKAFAAAIEAKCGDHVRLSIHPSQGLNKLSIPLIPQPEKKGHMTPWHCTIAVGLDGSYKTCHHGDLKGTHDVIYQNGHPHHLREKSDLWDLGPVKVEYEHLYPCGLIVRPSPAYDPKCPPSFRDIDTSKVRQLAELQSPVVLRGFAETTNKELYIKKAEEMGAILPWMFGQVMVVKDQKKVDRGSNNVASNEAMPMHYDGIFKFRPKKDEHGNVVKDENGSEVQIQIPPRFQLFSAKATAPTNSGFTLFAESRLFLQYLPAPYTLSRLQAVRWRLHSIGYWHGLMQHMPLLTPHPVTGVPTLRWHEDWPASKTKYSTATVEIENDEQRIVPMVDRLLYDRRVCLRFSWREGDILLADNSSMMHTRTGFPGGSERELWRIHLDEMEVEIGNLEKLGAVEGLGTAAAGAGEKGEGEKVAQAVSDKVKELEDELEVTKKRLGRTTRAAAAATAEEDGRRYKKVKLNTEGISA